MSASSRAARIPGLVAFLVVLAVAPSALADDPDPFWGRDKALHFAVAGALAGAGYGVTTAFADERWKAFAIGGSAALAAGAGKEALDAAGYGDPSWKDFTWDVIGAVAGLGVAWIIDVGAHAGHVPPLTSRIDGAATTMALSIGATSRSMSLRLAF